MYVYVYVYVCLLSADCTAHGGVAAQVSVYKPDVNCYWKRNRRRKSQLISILLFYFYSTLSIVLYGAVEHWLSGALVSVDDVVCSARFRSVKYLLWKVMIIQ